MPAYLSYFSDLVSVVTSSFTSFITGVGSGITSLFQGLLLEGAGTESDPYTLTAFATYGLVFMGITLAIGIVSWIIHKVAR